MSEYRLQAYFIDHEQLAAAAGSNSAELAARVRADEDGLADSFAGNHDGIPPLAAAEQLLAGKDGSEQNPFAYSYGAWMLTAAVSEEAPQPDVIGYPFTDLYAVTETFRGTPYGRLTHFLEALNGERENELPLRLASWAELPGTGYVPAGEISKLAGEARRCRRDFTNDEDWTLELDEPEDIVQILEWIEAAHERKTGLAVFMDGDL